MSSIIFDCCSNHLGDLKILEQMILKFAEIQQDCNCINNMSKDIIKFQAFNVNNLSDNFDKEYYSKIQLTEKHYDLIQNLCNKYNLRYMFTIFSEDIIPIVLKYSSKFRFAKIASPDANNWSLIDNCLKSFNNVLVSTGMHSYKQIKNLFNFAQYTTNGENIRTLYCISKYPTHKKDIDFEVMQLFDGFSDHTQEIESSKIAIELEMPYIERHYTLSKDLCGKDHHISSTPSEFKELVQLRNYLENIPKYKKRWSWG